jgi:hypothetical protein
VFPLIAIAPDGTDRVIVKDEGFYAAVYPGADGSARLVYDGHDAGQAYTISELAVGEHAASTVCVGDGPWMDPPAALVRATPWTGIEVRGWMPVFPGGFVYLWDKYLDVFGDIPRLLIDLDHGTTVDLGTQGAA